MTGDTFPGHHWSLLLWGEHLLEVPFERLTEFLESLRMDALRWSYRGVQQLLSQAIAPEHFIALFRREPLQRLVERSKTLSARRVRFQSDDFHVQARTLAMCQDIQALYR